MEKPWLNRDKGDGELQNVELLPTPWQWRSELKLLLHLAGPIVVVNVVLLAIQLSSVMFVGHLDELSLARATIATSFANVIGVSVMTGMATALDTYCGQAYGAGEHHLVGFYLQQGLVTLNLSAIPLAILFIYMGSILNAVGQDTEISIGAGYYTRCLIPALFGVATSQPFVRFLLAQSLVMPVLLCSFATLSCHLLVGWTLVYRSGLGYQGAAVATSVSYWIFAIMLAVYVLFSKTCKRCRVSWSWKVFRDLKYFFQLAIPSSAMICLEWWCYELLVLIAGLLPNPQLQASALSVCLNIDAILFQLPYGIGIAASTRVSNELGRGNDKTARNAVKLVLGMALTEASVLSIALLCLHKKVGKVFSDDAEVIAYVSKIIIFLSINVLFDAVQATLGGVLRGCGLQKAGAFINLGSFYCVGLPIGCLLAFKTSLEGEVQKAAVRIGSIKEPLLMDSEQQEVRYIN